MGDCKQASQQSGSKGKLMILCIMQQYSGSILITAGFDSYLKIAVRDRRCVPKF